MMRVTIDGDTVRFGSRLGVTFMRTLRIPDDGKQYPLPPGLGSFPLRRVRDCGSRAPVAWRERGGLILPMYQREAMWLMFNAPHWRPCAVKIGIGKINAISGEPWDERIEPGRQDYIVCPTQPWLDGIKAGEGFIRQFVAMPLGMGYTVEGQVSGKEEFGGVQIVVYAPKPGRFPARPPQRARWMFTDDLCMSKCCVCDVGVGYDMGLGAGGCMRQSIYPDPYGADTWDQSNTRRLFVHIANSLAWREITGEEPPTTPVSARSYSASGLPWFDLYDEQAGDIVATPVLAGVKSVKQLDADKGFAPQQDDAPVALDPDQVVVLGAPDAVEVSDGVW
ncbi:MAG: hypothetical protein Q7W56_00560 [Candidatus Latescibacteria bacterium]|nr:hypothetical protein [Candidatus Latescibacterota bacterium]